MADLFQEIMDDVRADNTSALWSRYGKWIIYISVSIVIVTAGVVYYNHHRKEVAMRQTAIYLQASNALAKGDGKQALAILQSVEPKKNSAFESLVLLKTAEAQQLTGDEKQAQATLAALAGRKDAFADIAALIATDSTKADADATSPVYYSKREAQAWQLAGSGKNKEASDAFLALAQDDAAPATLRERAMALANYLDVSKE